MATDRPNYVYVPNDALHVRSIPISSVLNYGALRLEKLTRACVSLLQRNTNIFMSW